MGSKKFNKIRDKKNTVNNKVDSWVPTNLIKPSDNTSVNSVETNKLMRCHICCKNFSTEEYYCHKMKFHVPSKNTVSNTKYTDSSTKNMVTNTKRTVSSTKNTDSSTKINQRIDYNVKQPEVTTKLNKKLPHESGYDNWKCTLCPSLIINSSTFLQHVKTYHHSTNSRLPVKQISPNNNIPIVLLKRSNFAGICRKRWTRSIKEHIKAVLDFNVKVRRFNCEFCKKSCMDPDHFEIHQWSRSTMVFTSFKCTVCPKSFETQTQLNMHKTLHV